MDRADRIPFGLNGAKMMVHMTKSDNPNLVTMKTNTLKIVIIDNDEKQHPLYQSYFKDELLYELMEIYTSVNQFISTSMGTGPDIVVSEVNLTGISGIDGIQYFSKQNITPKILMVGQECNFETIKRSF